MTNDLEKQFFDTFGIESRHKCTDGALEPCDEQCNECGYYELRYPQITDRILLELICINNNHAKYMEEFIVPRVLKTLKEQTLDMLMSNVKDYTDIKHQVRTLFEEG